MLWQKSWPPLWQKWAIILTKRVIVTKVGKNYNKRWVGWWDRSGICDKGSRYIREHVVWLDLLLLWIYALRVVFQPLVWQLRFSWVCAYLGTVQGEITFVIGNRSSKFMFWGGALQVWIIWGLLFYGFNIVFFLFF